MRDRPVRERRTRCLPRLTFAQESLGVAEHVLGGPVALTGGHGPVFTKVQVLDLRLYPLPESALLGSRTLGVTFASEDLALEFNDAHLQGHLADEVPQSLQSGGWCGVVEDLLDLLG